MNNTIKRLLGYFLYMIFFGLVFYWSLIYQQYLERQMIGSFNAKLIMLYMATYPVVLGMLLALPLFICTVRKSGQWYLDWVKLLGVGLPSLYITFNVLIYFTLGNLLPNLFFWPGHRLLSISEIPITMFGLIFGHTLLTAIKKKST
ncbi:MAG: hypothetical protein FH758_10250 [Firmicutes bacterium]|nr:hypothetical protein [Bacillota bacterium]